MPVPIRSTVFVGTAGWSVPAGTGSAGTHLERYARVFRCVEINSSFYRAHRAATYARWASATPAGFRFAVKMPKAITHEHRLRGTRELLDRFLNDTGGLGTRRGPLLVQLPPSFAYSAHRVGRFLRLLRRRYDGPVVIEPRHPSWFSPAANALLLRYRASRVGADPPVAAGADAPAGWPALQYVRLHGSPRMYWSSYDTGALTRLAAQLQLAVASGADVWCIFDNTASGAAFHNARDLRLHSGGVARRPKRRTGGT